LLIGHGVTACSYGDGTTTWTHEAEDGPTQQPTCTLARGGGHGQRRGTSKGSGLHVMEEESTLAAKDGELREEEGGRSRRPYQRVHK